MDKLDWKLIAATITGIGLVAGAVNSLYQKLRSILQPLLRRRNAKIAILHNENNKDSAADFAKRLRSRGYQNVDLTAMPEALLGRQVVIIWQPKEEMVVGQVTDVQHAASNAILLIFTYAQLPVERSERILLSNSKLRLLSDLSTLAEGLTTSSDLVG